MKEARDAYRSFMDAYLPGVKGKDHLKREDQKWTIAREKSEFLIIVFGSPIEAYAETPLKAAEEKLPEGRSAE